jgi:hypothetical protein
MYAYFDEYLPINPYSQNLFTFHKILNNMECFLRLVRLPVRVVGCSILVYLLFQDTVCHFHNTAFKEWIYSKFVWLCWYQKSHCTLLITTSNTLWSLQQYLWTVCDSCHVLSSSHIIIHDFASFPKVLWRGVKLVSNFHPMINFLQYQKWRQWSGEPFTLLGWNLSLFWHWVT